jgi:hypothetical protein
MLFALAVYLDHLVSPIIYVGAGDTCLAVRTGQAVELAKDEGN